jgi:hypothetical protein
VCRNRAYRVIEASEADKSQVPRDEREKAQREKAIET